jgi:hypothetical protein
MKARLYLDVKFGGRATDAESITTAMDNVIKCGMSALDDCWGEYGGVPQVGEVFVLDTEAALMHANDIDKLINSFDLRESLGPIRDFLRNVAGRK